MNAPQLGEEKKDTNEGNVDAIKGIEIYPQSPSLLPIQVILCQNSVEHLFSI